MSFNGNNIPFAYLMQPELLQEHEIRSILIERCVRVDNIERMNKEQLLNIFYRVITPLQQRTRSEIRRTDLNGLNRNISQINNTEIVLKNGILKSIVGEHNAKKIKLCTSLNKVQLKRPITEKSDEELPVLKKARQKITWP